MGVMGSWCQLCGLPVQHDHYVATEVRDRWNIYRHTPPSCAPAFAILPEHAWLLDAVYLGDGEPAFGLVEDGALGEHFVEDGCVVHRFCWELAGSPLEDPLLKVTPGLHEWQLLAGYHEQLFAFERFLADGNGELLLPSRERVEGMIAEGRRVLALPSPTTAEHLRMGNQWNRVDQETSFYRFRADVPEVLEPLDYATYFRIGAPVSAGMDTFERLLLKTVQPHGVVLLCRGAEKQWTYIGYTRDLPALRAAVDGMEQGTYFNAEADPGWGRYYEGFHAHLAGAG